MTETQATKDLRERLAGVDRYADAWNASNYLVNAAKEIDVLALCRVYSDCITYRGYIITYWAKPIPDRRWDWDFRADDFDWAPDGPDPRHGSAASLAAAMAEIDEQLEDAA